MAQNKLPIVIKYLRTVLDPASLASFDAELVAVKPRAPIKDPVSLDYQTWEWSGISQDLLSFWKKTFPSLEIEAELRNAAAWVRANPERRKVRYSKFLYGWMMRARNPKRTIGNRPASDERAEAWARKDL
jgi:hypothetical protein